MKPVKTGKTLYETAKKLEKGGCVGFLLSGGSDSKGMVPLKDHISSLERVKEDTSLIINVHTGLVDDEMVKWMKRIKPHVISYDMIGSARTLKEIYGSNAEPEEYLRGYNALKKAGLRVVPHVTVGLHEGRLLGEYRAIDMIDDSDVIVLNSLIPSEIDSPVDDDDFLSVLKYALEHTSSKIYIGCMRERGNHRLEKRSIQMGIDGIVMPSRKTLKWARESHDINIFEECCAVHL